MTSWWYRNWAVWFTPLFGFALIFGSAPDGSGEGYALARSAATAQALVLLAPLTSLAAAWEGARLRSGRVFALPTARYRTAIVASPLVWVIAIPLVMMTFVLFQRAGLTGLIVVVTSSAVIVAWALVGVLMGLSLPMVVALPSALLVPAAVLVLPPALEPLWLRHLTGAWEGCCLTNQVLAPEAVAAAVIFNATLAVTACVGMALLGRVRRGIAVIAILTSFGIGITLAAVPASTLSVFPVAPRSGETNCFQATVEVCVWPEHVELQPRLTAIAEPIIANWRRAGVAVPSRFDEATYQWGDASHAPLLVNLRADDLGLATSLSAAMIGPTTCSAGAGSAVEMTDPTRTLAMLMLVGGVDEADVAKRLGSPAVQAAGEALATGDVNLNDLIARVRSCR